MQRSERPRYARVKKRFEQTDLVEGAMPEDAIVYNIGTLYGTWPDGTLFEGNRYVDRYVVQGGLIVQMDVWNDSAEWMLERFDLPQLAQGSADHYHLLVEATKQAFMIYGAQGACGQPQTLAALLSRLIDYPMDPLQALAQPRFLLGKTFSNAHNAIRLKADIAPEVREALALRGHAISMVDAHSPLMSHPGAKAQYALGGMRGAHDPRSDGYAIGCA
jgi:hypothetical protein